MYSARNSDFWLLVLLVPCTSTMHAGIEHMGGQAAAAWVGMHLKWVHSVDEVLEHVINAPRLVHFACPDGIAPS